MDDPLEALKLEIQVEWGRGEVSENGQGNGELRLGTHLLPEAE